ncbi:hypothetical protein ACHAPT_012331 [Fusarium lateritium]
MATDHTHGQGRLSSAYDEEVIEEKRPSSKKHRFRWQCWPSVDEHAKHLTINYSSKERLEHIWQLVDDNGFNFRVFFVAASGFLASSYTLFATNVIAPAISFVYPSCTMDGEASSTIDMLTLVGSIFGMLLMGHFADRHGRKKLYGLELLILIVATMGVTQASSGIASDNESSMDIYSWLIWWRMALGFGIGAEYPISAIIVAEWASTKSRGLMLASVKSMQSLARLLAVGIGLGVLRAIRPPGAASDMIKDDFSDPTNLATARRLIDKVWRWDIGVAIIPAAIAIVARVTIPETPRYHADIRKDLRQAVKNSLQVYKDKKVKETNTDAAEPPLADDQSDRWFRGAWDYLKQDSHRGLQNLCLISMLWGIMDVGFYGLSLDSPTVLSILINERTHEDSHYKCTTEDNEPRAVPTWRPMSEPDHVWNIYDILDSNSVRSLLIVSIASMMGSLAALLMVNYFRRKMILLVTFLIAAILFTITGAVLHSTYDWNDPTARHVVIVFYAITQFIYNAGPNTMIFVLAAEIFPTVYRGTFYGVAAATGKVGAIIIRSVILGLGDGHEPLAIRLIVFGPLMLVAALISWYLPDVQDDPDQESRDLEASSEPRVRPAVNESGTDIVRPPHVALSGPRVPAAGEEDPEDILIPSDTDSDSVRSSESDRPRQPVGRKSTRFFARLKNLTLEQIAPNPQWRRRRSRAVGEMSSSHRPAAASTTGSRPGVFDGEVWRR